MRSPYPRSILPGIRRIDSLLLVLLRYDSINFSLGLTGM